MGTAMHSVPKVKELLSKYKLHYDMAFTERPWHASELAEETARSGYDAAIAMGGDGTVNEVINGLMQVRKKHDHRCALGVLCVGRGNDFAFGAGIPQDLEEGCRILAQGQKRNIDVGHVIVDGSSRGRYFGNGIGIGFDAVVGFEAAKMEHLHGFLSYLIAALKTLFLNFRAPSVQIECDDRNWTQSSLLISVMNGRRMGGGFMMAPQAEPDDGRLDLCIGGTAGRLHLLYLMTCFLKGTQNKSKLITTGRTRSITVKAIEGVLPAHADGETLCTEGRELKVELLPQQLEIIC